MRLNISINGDGSSIGSAGGSMPRRFGRICKADEIQTGCSAFVLGEKLAGIGQLLFSKYRGSEWTGVAVWEKWFLAGNPDDVWCGLEALCVGSCCSRCLFGLVGLIISERLRFKNSPLSQIKAAEVNFVFWNVVKRRGADSPVIHSRLSH